MADLNLLAIFLTGLTTGGLTCLAIQGGLLASVIAKQESTSKGNRFLPIASFLFGKIIIYSLLGLLLGLIGQSITLTPIARGWIQIFIGIYLLGIAGNLLDLHPIFRYFVITPPKSLARLARNESRRASIFAPFVLGLTTVFLPCASTQAAELIAITTSNPLSGTLVMLSFTLGTVPTFIIFGYLLSSGVTSFRRIFPKMAAVLLLGLSLYSINNGVSLTGSIYTVQNFIEAAKNTPRSNSILGDNIQSITITVTNSGYTPTNITLKKDVPVRLTLITKNVESCSRAFTIPGLNLQKLLPETGETVIEFTPKNNGPLAFSCSMGMYTGRFNIIN